MKTTEHRCEYCKNPFQSRRMDTMYCSHSCRQRNYVLRKAKSGVSDLPGTEQPGDFQTPPAVSTVPPADSPLPSENRKEAIVWLEIRYRCIIDRLLSLSEKPVIHITDLLAVCDVFESMLDSDNFRKVEADYHLAKEMLDLNNSMALFCMGSKQDLMLEFELKPATKIKLLESRARLLV